MKRLYLIMVATMVSLATFSQGIRSYVAPAKYQNAVKAAQNRVPSEDEIVSEQPEGTLKLYLRTGRAMMASWGYVDEYDQNGSVAQVVFGDDGQTVWFYMPLSSLRYPVWVKGTLSADGTTVTVPAGQLVYYGVTDPDEDNEGGEVWGLRLHILEISDNGDGSYTYVIAEGDPDIVWTIDDETGELRLTSTDIDAYNIMGLIYDTPEDPEADGQWNGYADYATVYVPFSDEPVTIPEGLTTVPYAMQYEYDNGWQTQYLSKKVEAGFDGDNVYITKFSKDYPDTWIKGTVSGSTVTFPRQFMLINEWNDAVYFNAYDKEEVVEPWGSYFKNKLSYDDVVFTYDAEARSFSTDMNCNVNPSAIAFSGQEMFEKPVFTAFVEKAATPADPEITSFYGWEGEKGYSSQARLSIPCADVDGNFIDPDKLSFCFYTSETELYHFVRDNYIRTEEEDGWNFTPEWEDGMTEIPYTYTDGSGYISAKAVFFYYGELERLGVQTIYRGGGEEHRSNIYFYGEGIVTGLTTPQAAQTTGHTVYDLTGRRVSTQGKGFFVERTRQADGSVTTRKVVRR